MVDIVPQDAATDAAIAAVGGNLLDPTIRATVAGTGRAFGRPIAADVAQFWG